MEIILILSLILVFSIFVYLFRVRSNNKKLAAKEKKIALAKEKKIALISVDELPVLGNGLAERIAYLQSQGFFNEQAASDNKIIASIKIKLKILRDNEHTAENDNIDNDYIPLKSSHLRGLNND